MTENMSEWAKLSIYENWKSKKRKRKIWMGVIAFFLALLFGYTAGNLLCKVGLTKTKRILSYGLGTNESDLKTENQKNLPKDYTEWYKKVKENVWVKKFGEKEDYYTKGKIKEREFKKQGKKWGGNILGEIASWFSSIGLSEEEAKKVDYYYYANHVYTTTGAWLIISWVLFYIVFHLLLRYLILPLIWKEPKLKE